MGCTDFSSNYEIPRVANIRPEALEIGSEGGLCMCCSYRKVVGGDSVTTPSIRLFAGLERELWEGLEIGSEGGLCMCHSYRKVVG